MPPQTGAALVLMHNRGRSRDMYERAVYGTPSREVAAELERGARPCGSGRRRGERRSSSIPGWASRSAPTHSYEVLAGLDEIAALDRPVLCGASRKSFLKAALGERPADQREWGTAAAVAASILFGAHIVRVHNVPAMVDVARVSDRRDSRAAAVDRDQGVGDMSSSRLRNFQSG